MRVPWIAYNRGLLDGQPLEAPSARTYPPICTDFRPDFGQDNGRPYLDILCIRSVPGRTSVTCSVIPGRSMLSIALQPHGFHRPRPGAAEGPAPRARAPRQGFPA